MGMAISVVGLACYGKLRTANGDGPLEAGMVEQTSAKSPEEAIKNFIALAEKGQIKEIAVYYRRWEQPEIHSITEEALIRAAHLEVTQRGAILREPLLKLANALNHPNLTRRKTSQKDLVDFGLGFICHSNGKEVIRVAISKRPAILSINGERFMLPPEVLYALAPLLPGVVYEGMLAHIVTQWAPPGPWHELPKELQDELGSR
jgi:hypothetical protein